MKKIKNLALLLVVLALAFVVIGCSNDTPEVPLSGNGTVSSPFQVATEAHLKKAFETAAQSSPTNLVYIEQTTDISLTGNWDSGIAFTRDGANITGGFYGVYDGKNHKITGLTIRGGNNTASSVGFIPALVGSGSAIQNVTFENVDVQGDEEEQTGAVVGVLAHGATVKNVKVLSGTVEGYQGVGGIIGRTLKGVTIEDVENGTNVTAVKGERAGKDNGKGGVEGAYNAGGIVGALYRPESVAVSIKNAKNTGTVTAEYNAGGVIGYVVSAATSTFENLSSSTVGVITSNTSDNSGSLIGTVASGSKIAVTTPNTETGIGKGLAIGTAVSDTTVTPVNPQ